MKTKLAISQTYNHLTSNQTREPLRHGDGHLPRAPTGKTNLAPMPWVGEFVFVNLHYIDVQIIGKAKKPATTVAVTLRAQHTFSVSRLQSHHFLLTSSSVGNSTPKS